MLGLLPPLAYFVLVWAKGSLSLVDAAVLASTYVAYLGVLLQDPAARGDRRAGRRGAGRLALGALVLAAASAGRPSCCSSAAAELVIFLVAEPFLNSMLALAASLGMSQFVFIQWVAPFLSEFPEKTSAFAWARRVTRAPVALMNMVSSNINQWGILSGPARGHLLLAATARPSRLPFDAFQRSEILLTILQAFLGWLFLASMDLEAYEAAGLFLLWLIQFLVPSSRHAMLFVYGAWIAARDRCFVAVGRKKLTAFRGVRARLEGPPMSRPRLSRRAAGLAPSSTVAVGKAAKALAATGVDVVDFGIGEPDFATPGLRGARPGSAAIARGAHQVHRRGRGARPCATRSRRSTARSRAPTSRATTCS